MSSKHDCFSRFTFISFCLFSKKITRVINFLKRSRLQRNKKGCSGWGKVGVKDAATPDIHTKYGIQSKSSNLCIYTLVLEDSFRAERYSCSC